MKIKAVISFALLFLLSACSEEVIQQNPEQRVPLNLAAVSEAAITRTGTNIQGSTFDAGALINAYIPVTGASDGTETIGNPVVMKAEAADANGINALSPNDGSVLYYPPGDNVKVDIYALYPKEVMSSFTSFTVQNPQTSDADYKASDLMFAKTSESQAKSDQTVHLQFTHKMAKLIVNAFGDEGVTIKSIKLKNFSTTVGFNTSTGVLGDLSDKTDITIASSADFASSLSGVALFPPQTKDDTEFIEVEAKTTTGSPTTAYFYVITKQFESGKVYTVNMTIGPKNLADDGKVTIDTWPSTVGTVSVAPVGSLGLTITNLTDDGDANTNTMKANGTYDYNGKVCLPIPTVTDGKPSAEPLTKDTHYEVEYYNNINAGTALVVVRGKGSYDGLSTFKTFNINRITNTMSYPSNSVTQMLSKNGVVPNVLQLPSLQTTEVYGKMEYKIYSDAAMTTLHPTDPTDANCIATVDGNGNVRMQRRGGPVYIKATMDGTGNYEAATATYNLTVIAGDAESVMTVELTDGNSYVYTGSAITPAFTVYDNGNTLASGTDYTYSYSNNTNVGAATITITGKGEYEGTKTVNFNITKATNEFTTLNIPSIPIDCGDWKESPQGGRKDTLSIAAETFEIGGVAKFGNSVSYSSDNTAVATVNASTGVVTAVAPGTANITASVAGTTNYTALTQTITVKVEKMTYVYVYNGNTGNHKHSASPSTVETATYWSQVSGGSAQECSLSFTANATVYFVLVGAAGGNDTATGRGGLGGLVVASKGYSQTDNPTFYVFCGGGGYSDTQGDPNDPVRSLGGWPGGGRPGVTGCSGAGGGATVVATTNSMDNWDFSDNDSRLLVAGAGGGSSNQGYGGESGNKITETTEKFVGTMKNCTSGRAKWNGGNVNVAGECSTEASPTADGGAGGAGYYGGFSGLEVNGEETGTVATGGHGGSNYIASGFTEIFNAVSSSQTFTQIGVSVTENGHPQTSTTVEERQNVYPGYVIIRYKYNVSN